MKTRKAEAQRRVRARRRVRQIIADYKRQASIGHDRRVEADIEALEIVLQLSMLNAVRWLRS